MMMAINSDSYSISVHNVIIRMTLVSVIKFKKKKKSFLLECVKQVEYWLIGVHAPDSIFICSPKL